VNKVIGLEKGEQSVQMNPYNGPLRNAANNGLIEQVRDLLQLGAEIDDSNQHGQTALLLAVRRHHVEVADILLEHGANPLARDKTNWTPLTAAVSNGDQVVVEAILNHSTAISPEALQEALRWGVIAGGPKIVRRLLVAGAKVVGLSDIRERMLALARKWEGMATELSRRAQYEEVVKILEECESGGQGD
jgi:ankyrin repeat protein